VSVVDITAVDAGAVNDCWYSIVIHCTYGVMPMTDIYEKVPETVTLKSVPVFW